MGKSKNNKSLKKRNASKKSKHLNISDQKENVPKNKVTKSKRDPNDSIAMSKQLLMKRTNVRSKPQARTRSENRICGNGKPIPSLADLEKMFEDSDEDDQSPKTPVKEACTPSTQKMSPDKQMSENLREEKLLSPSTINKISEKLLDMISNISNPIELLDNVQPTPIVPPKKRKKPDVPYIVGCKDRPQVIRKPNANFCKGDEEYGVQESGDPDEPPTKRAKKSRIPNYSKSIFNASSDEIAARLTKDEAGVLSDASSDSSKTIEYDPTQFRNQRPHRFSPLPSTSKDNETFIKNDKLFNDSLRENNDIKDETSIEKKDEVQIIDTPYETIVIDDVVGKQNPPVTENTSNVNNTVNSKLEKIIALEDSLFNYDVENEIYETNNDDDCVLVPSSTQTNNHNSDNQPIDIDDEYSNINMDNITFEQEVIEVIDIDDVIAENKSILDKWKNTGEKFDKINTVVDVPKTYRYSTTPQTSDLTPSIKHNLNTTQQNNETLSQSIPNNNSLPISHNTSSLNSTNANLFNSIPVIGNSNLIQSVVTDFFRNNDTAPRTNNNISSNSNNTSCMRSIFDAVIGAFRRVQAPASITAPTRTQPLTYIPPTSNHILMHSFGNANNVSNGLITIDLCQEKNTVSSSRANHSYVGASGESSVRHNIGGTAIQPSTSSGQESQATNMQCMDAPVQAASAPNPRKPEASRNLGECPICLDPLSGNGIASTICGHVFCLKCIQTAVKANGKRCPTCRKVLKGAGGGYHQLYL